MKKNIIVAASLVGTAFIALELIKRHCNISGVKEKEVDGERINECVVTDKGYEEKKTKNHNENIVRVNNSLVSIKIKAFNK